MEDLIFWLISHLIAYGFIIGYPIIVILTFLSFIKMAWDYNKFEKEKEERRRREREEEEKEKKKRKRRRRLTESYSIYPEFPRGFCCAFFSFFNRQLRLIFRQNLLPFYFINSVF